MQGSTETPRPLPLDWVLVFSLAVAVVLPDGPKFGLILFGLWGLYLTATRRSGNLGLLEFWSASGAIRATGFMLAGFLAMSLLLLAYQQAGTGEYEHLIPFFLFPFACLALASQSVRKDFFAMGIGLGGLGSGLMALTEVLSRADELPINLLRAQGWMTNPVQFGNVCIFLSASCLVVLVTERLELTRLRRWVLFLGFSSALLGAILSGSKGSLLAFMVFSAYFLGLVLAWQLVSRKVLVGAVTSLLFLLTVLVLVSPLAERLRTFHGSVVTIASAVSSSNYQFNLEGLALDESASNRLAQYKIAIELIQANPWTGMTRSDIIQEQKRRIEAQTPGFIQATRFIHSDYLDLLLNKGLWVFAVLTGFFLGLWYTLLRGRVPENRASPLCGLGSGSQAFLLGSSILLLLATMGLFNVVIYRVPETSPAFFILAYCMALSYRHSVTNKKSFIKKPVVKAA